eukprot:13516253-Alexandrium_andersonii.AAC.1
MVFPVGGLPSSGGNLSGRPLLTKRAFSVHSCVSPCPPSAPLSFKIAKLVTKGGRSHGRNAHCTPGRARPDPLDRLEAPSPDATLLESFAMRRAALFGSAVFHSPWAPPLEDTPVPPFAGCAGAMSMSRT